MKAITKTVIGVFAFMCIAVRVADIPLSDILPDSYIFDKLEQSEGEVFKFKFKDGSGVKIKFFIPMLHVGASNGGRAYMIFTDGRKAIARVSCKPFNKSIIESRANECEDIDAFITFLSCGIRMWSDVKVLDK